MSQIKCLTRHDAWSACSVVPGGEERKTNLIGDILGTANPGGGSVWTAEASQERVLSSHAQVHNVVGSAGAGDEDELEAGDRHQPESPSLKRRLESDQETGGVSSPVFERLKSPRCQRHPPSGRPHSPIREHGTSMDFVRSHTHFLPIGSGGIMHSNCYQGGHVDIDIDPTQLASPISKFFTPTAIDLGAEARFFGEMADGDMADN